jgi:hypothetical protein
MAVSSIEDADRVASSGLACRLRKSTKLREAKTSGARVKAPHTVIAMPLIPHDMEKS